MIGLTKYLKNQDGNFAVMTAALGLPLALAVGVAIDMNSLQHAKSKLRDAAETAAIASARSHELSDGERRKAAKAHLERNFNVVEQNAKSLKMHVELTPTRSTVEARTRIPAKLLGIVGKKHITVSVKVAAETVFEPACVLINAPNRDHALRFQGHPTLNTEDCYIHNNSNSLRSATAQGNPVLANAEVCLNGGYEGKKWVPAPEEGCGQRQDPFLGLLPPVPEPCGAEVPKSKKGETLKLSPGNYCKGLKIPANTDVVFEPGIYTVSDSQLEIKSNSSLSGDGVTFHLSGNDSNFEISTGSDWNITPPKSGDYKGMTIFQDRGSNPKNPNKFTGGGSLSLTGNIYTPNADLELHGSPEVTLTGSATVLVINTLKLQGSPVLLVRNIDDPDLLNNDRLIGRDAYIRVIH